MSLSTVRGLAMYNAMKAVAKEEAKAKAAGIDVTAEDYGAPRNRAEKRRKVRTLPRQFRINVHGMGQWRRKVVTENGLERV